MHAPGKIVTLRCGAYTLRTPLAQSSYGLVWRADGPCGPVALKLVNAARMAQADVPLRARWAECARRERDFLAALAPWDRRHIVGLLDAGEHEGLPALALELLDTDLARETAGKPVPFARALGWLAQANQALAKVHQHGWRHLDFKPANLLLDRRSGLLKLADFGTLVPLSDQRPHPYTGTAAWQAPEQFVAAPGGFVTDARSDYYALGLLFYYLACGEQPAACRERADWFGQHGSAAGRQLAARHGGRLPPALSGAETARFASAADCWNPGASGAALGLLRALLAPRREHRPRHALEISRALRAIGQPASPMRSAA